MEKVWHRIRPPRARIERVGEGAIAFSANHTIFLREYYLYCVDLFRTALRRNGAAMNLVVGDYACTFGNDKPTYRVDIQYEHTLVKPGGRDSEGALRGKIPIFGEEGTYLVRLANWEYLNALDLIIEYSRANLANARTAPQAEAYVRKAVQIAPLVYEPDFGMAAERSEIISLFADVRQPRRREFLQKAAASGLPLRNRKGLYGGTELKALYRHTRILVNVHQTDHHHTLEELRVLPALLCGVIVVSEEVPLKEEIPYADFIVWSRYEDLVETALSVERDYARHFEAIFGNPALPVMLAQLQSQNMANVAVAVQNLGASPR